MTRFRFASAVLLSLPLAVAAPFANAQDYDRPPAGVGDDGGGYGNSGGGYGNSGGADGGASQDPAALGLRITRMESRIREMTGQIEELQNANRRLVEQLQKFQADVDQRLSSGPRAKRAEATPDVAPAPAPSEDAGAAKPRKSARTDDSFDPDVAPVGTPGKPKPLGSAASAQPDDAGGAPMDLSGGRLRASGADAGAIAPTLRLPSSSTTPKTALGASTTPSTSLADVNPATPRAEFDAALGLYKDKQFDNAEKGFAAFIAKNPKSRLVADATYYLGETFAQRGRSREAAEQYLKISTDYASSSRAPDAMLHLGMSLKALGAKEQACATFAEVTRKYPNAPAYVKSGAERESKRAAC